MPRKAMGPRLYLRKDGDKRVWIIRDRNGDTRTGCAEDQRAEAMGVLAGYVERDGSPISPTPEPGTGYIYFVTCLASADYPIKIGWSETPPRSRLRQLQNGNPNLLTVAATLNGTRDDERRLHLYFAHLHIRGEWHLRGEDLLEYIGGLPGQTRVYGEDALHSNRTAMAPDQPKPTETGMNKSGADGV